MNDHYVNGSVSALVMLAAIALTFTTYSSYRDTVATEELERATAGMEQTATAMLSYRLEKAKTLAPAATTTETEDESVDAE